ncbi:MAG: tRNA1(Val) (adenine(37)-N6)-methyltransferase [Prevotella sp.]
MGKDSFDFKQFSIKQDRCAMKVGTDGVLLGSWACDRTDDEPLKILDVGTGTGLIALFLAQRFQNAGITAIDIDPEAVEQAKENFTASPFGNRLTALASPLQEFLGEATFDAIVCNPPFFVDSLQCPDDKRTLARHAKTLTFAELARHSSRLLTKAGTLSVIIPSDRKVEMEAEAIFCGLFVSRVCHIKTKETKPAKRVMLEFSKCQKHIENDILVIGNEKFVSLTCDFYL